IGPFFGEVSRAFADDPGLGVVGCYDTWAWGELRSFTPWDRQVPRVARRVSVWKRPQRRTPIIRLALSGRHAEIRRMIIAAQARGYRPGEHCLGGAYAVGAQLLAELERSGLLGRPELWVDAPLSEDVVMGLCTRHLGFHMRG